MLEISVIGLFMGVLILVILILNLQSSPLANKLLIGIILPFTLAQLLFYLYVSGLAIYVPYFYRLPSPLYLAGNRKWISRSCSGLCYHISIWPRRSGLPGFQEKKSIYSLKKKYK